MIVSIGISFMFVCIQCLGSLKKHSCYCEIIIMYIFITANGQGELPRQRSCLYKPDEKQNSKHVQQSGKMC